MHAEGALFSRRRRHDECNNQTKVTYPTFIRTFSRSFGWVSQHSWRLQCLQTLQKGGPASIHALLGHVSLQTRQRNTKLAHTLEDSEHFGSRCKSPTSTFPVRGKNMVLFLVTRTRLAWRSARRLAFSASWAILSSSCSLIFFEMSLTTAFMEAFISSLLRDVFAIRKKTRHAASKARETVQPQRRN